MTKAHIFLINNPKDIEGLKIPKGLNSLVENLGDKSSFISNFEDGKHCAVVICNNGKKDFDFDNVRKDGSKVCKWLNQNRIEAAEVNTSDSCSAYAYNLAEGILLTNYQFLKYKTKRNKLENTFVELNIKNGDKTTNLDELSNIIKAVYHTRNLVNEPQSFLNAVQMSQEFINMGKEAKFDVDVWDEAKIVSQKMGGLLAVNAGSTIPPTFNVMEYKPKKANNRKPIVLVGKGVIYDTGGYSLKPTANSMDFMKCDMAGGATVAGIIYAVAANKLPIHLVALVPATDNRIGDDAYAPGDVIKMYDKTTVEVMNTDAEGRLVLADALAYAKKYKPELVMDFATLTGSAARAIGSYGTVFMGNAKDDVKQNLKKAGDKTYERLVEFPLWKEYGEDLKSEIADLKNLGKGEGGSISAGMFLKHFTDYPWLHFDIAGPAYTHAAKNYWSHGGTGVMVRAIYDYLKNKYK